VYVTADAELCVSQLSLRSLFQCASHSLLGPLFYQRSALDSACSHFWADWWVVSKLWYLIWLPLYLTAFGLSWSSWVNVHHSSLPPRWVAGSGKKNSFQYLLTHCPPTRRPHTSTNPFRPTRSTIPTSHPFFTTSQTFSCQTALCITRRKIIFTFTNSEAARDIEPVEVSSNGDSYSWFFYLYSPYIHYFISHPNTQLSQW
jgi:hypothetical protein